MTNPDNVGGLRYTDHNVMNGALCDFATRWRIDGDYIRCGTCDRPQLTSYADNDFPHADFCRVKDSPSMERRPWQTYVALLAPLCRAAPAGGAPESLVKWERDYDDTHLAPYCREDVKRLLADWRASIAAPAGGDAIRDALAGQTIYLMGREHINEEHKPLAELVYGMTVPGTGVLFCMKDTEAAIPKDSAPAGSGEVDALVDELILAARANARSASSQGFEMTEAIHLSYEVNFRQIRTLLRKLQQGADENSLRAVAKRNLRSLINIGSDDKALMLKCLEELS